MCERWTGLPVAWMLMVRVGVFKRKVPFGGEALEGVNESVLRRRIEETDKIIVGCAQGDVWGCVRQVLVEVSPELWNGKLAGCLWEKRRIMALMAVDVARRRMPCADLK